MKESLESRKKLEKSIQKKLLCSMSRAKEIMCELRQTKKMFALNLSLSEIWQQEKPYLAEYGETSFNVGLLGSVGSTKSNEI